MIIYADVQVSMVGFYSPRSLKKKSFSEIFFLLDSNYHGITFNFGVSGINKNEKNGNDTIDRILDSQKNT